MTDRILWNPGDDPDIDEIVVRGCTVFVEQMDDRCWWIGITKGDAHWAGTFYADSRGRMRFTEQQNEGLVWDVDDVHDDDRLTDDLASEGDPMSDDQMTGKWRVSDAHGLCLVLSPDGTSQTDATLVLDATSPEVGESLRPNRDQLIELCERLNRITYGVSVEQGSDGEPFIRVSIDDEGDR